MNKKLCLSGLLLVAASASAQDTDFNVEITPFGGYTFGGTFDVEESTDSYELEDSSSFGVIVNWRHTGVTKWEVLYSRQETEADIGAAAALEPSVDIDLQVFQLGGTYLGEGSRARPYVAATIGGTHISPDNPLLDSDTFFSGSIGGGLQVFPSQRVGLRLEARVYGTLLSSSTSLFCSSGAQGALCAITVSGDALWQFETFAGVVFRF